MKQILGTFILLAFLGLMVAAMTWVILARAIPLWQEHPEAFIQAAPLALLFVGGLLGLGRLLIWAAAAAAGR